MKAHRPHNSTFPASSSRIARLVPIYILLFVWLAAPGLLHAQFSDIGAGLAGVGDATLAWADYDLDGDLDLLVAGKTPSGTKTTLYKNNGGSFSAVPNLPFIHISLGEVAWGDYDNDGDPDLLLTGQKNDGVATTQMYRNDTGSGSGSFTDINAGITAMKASMVDWGDFDGDGDLDFFIAGVGTDNLSITKVYRNNGGGKFSAIGAGLEGLRRGDGKWIDYDRDGDLDLLLTGRDTNDTRWSILYKNNNGSFSDSGINLPDVDLSAVTWADYDKDSYQELFVAGTSNSGIISRVYNNPLQSSGSIDLVTSLDGLEFASAQWGDYDMNGERDLAVMGINGSRNSHTRIYKWNGGSSFTDIGAGIIGLHKGALDWGDFDGDGDLDLAVAGYNSNDVAYTRIYRNTGNSSSTPPDPPFNLWTSKNGQTMNFGWGEALDRETPIHELTFNLRVGTSPGASNIVAPSSSRDGNMGTGNSYSIRNLSNGTYYWSIQTVDGSFTRSSYAFEQVFYIGDDQFSAMDVGLPAGAIRVGWGDLDNDGDLDAIMDNAYRNTNGKFSDMDVPLPRVQEAFLQVEDVDNDNDLDLLFHGDISDPQDGRGLVSGLYTNRSGSFSGAGVSIGFAYFCQQVYPNMILADVDNNGFPDLIHPYIGSDVDPQIGVRLNHNGAFEADFKPWGRNGNSGSLIAGDFTNDGKVDLYTVGLDNEQCNGPTASTLTNRGASFERMRNGPYSGWGGIPAFGDYDGDGRLDLMTSGHMFGQDDPGVRGDFAGIYRNTGNGFTLAAEILPDTWKSVSAWGDYDMDGDLDLLFTGATGSPLYENRNGTFVKIAGAFDEIEDIHAAWGDYDGDDDLDVLITGSLNGVAVTRVYSNTRSAKNDKPLAPTGLSASVNGASATLSWNAAKDEETPSSGLTYSVRIGTAPGKSDITSAEARSDGTLLTPRYGNVYHARNWTIQGLADGTYYWTVQAIDAGFMGSSFAAEKTFTVGNPPSTDFTDAGVNVIDVNEGDAEWGDYDNDGDLDLLIAGTTSSGRATKLYRNRRGSFIDSGINFTGLDLASLDWGDYDNDGNLDVIIMGRGGSNSHNTLLYRGTGSGFQQVNTGLPGLIAGSADWGDYDNDGDLDLLLTGRLSNLNNFAAVFRNVNGKFTNIGAGLQGIRRGQSAWVDYDVDGDLDILLTGRIDETIDRRTMLYQNNGGAFTEVADGLPDVDLSSIDWGDYDNDGDPDLLITGKSASVHIGRIYRNNSGTNTGTFTLVESLAAVEWSDARWGDYDNDGDLDILLTGRESNDNRLTRVYQNNGGSFSTIGAGMTGVSQSAVAWGDYDTDGDLDAFVTGQLSNNTRVSKLYKNMSSTPNSPPSAPGGLTHQIGADFLRLKWNQGTDDETLQGGLTYNLRLGTTPGGNEIIAAHSSGNGRRKLAEAGNIQHNRSWDIKPLAPGIYYWSVQSVDHGFAGSAFAGEQVFELVDPVLPVELTHFDAVLLDGGVQLRWETAGETNNAGFEIERAVDDGPFERLTFVEGRGTTTDAHSYRYEDLLIPFGATRVRYRLRQIDFDGAFSLSEEVTVDLAVPDAVSLWTNYPNPFNPTTEIRYELPAAVEIRLAVYDLTGKQVAVLAAGFQEAGRYSVAFDGSLLASGIYMYRLETPAKVVVRQMTLLK